MRLHNLKLKGENQKVIKAKFFALATHEFLK